MIGAQDNRGRKRASWTLVLLWLVAVLWAVPAAATPLHINAPLCHAVGPLAAPDDAMSALRFSCSGEPTGYRDGSLWLRADVGNRSDDHNGAALMVHFSRFDRLAVGFTYADGQTRWQTARRGDYGAHWRVGGQILFEAPARGAPLISVTMRFDRLADHGLLRARLIPKENASLQAGGMAALVGASLTLLLVSGIYSLSLAVAVRRQYLLWQAAWSGVMIVWGAFWSQIHLVIFPAMAGTVSAQASTLLACLAIGVATASAVTAIDARHLPHALRRGTLVLGLAIAIAGVPLALIRTGNLQMLGNLLGIAVIVDLVAVALCIGWSWRKGSVEARDFALAWCLPMATLAIIHLVDVEDGFWGGGSKLAVLVAATWQALWLSAASTRRLAHLRVERDDALAAEAQANELARRDPLTGLLNRRGFVDAVTPLLDQAREGALPAALLLVDVDRFKSINDIYGHEAGDAVLCRIAERIARWEGTMCSVARLGGEEFGLLTIGMEGIMLDRFAESIRREIALCDHSDTMGDRPVTASVGVAEVRPAPDFQYLYRIADEALYDAKRAGRNRINVQRVPPRGEGDSGADDRGVAYPA